MRQLSPKVDKINTIKVEPPYKIMVPAKNIAHESEGSESQEKSKIDEIHNFIDEWNEELKSIDQVNKQSS